MILQVRKSWSDIASKSELVRYALLGKRREMGIGSFPEVALIDAHEAALDVRHKIQDGVGAPSSGVGSFNSPVGQLFCGHQ